MSDTLLTIIVAIISAAGGFGLSLWSTRLRPWIAMLEFNENFKHADEVDIPMTLANAADKAWLAHLPSGKSRLKNVSDAFERAQIAAVMWEDNEIDLQHAIKSLGASKSPTEILEATRNALNKRGISDTLELAIIRQIIVAPKFDGKIKPKVRWAYDKNRGSFIFDLADALLPFGQNLESQPFRKELVLPVVELVSRLEKTKLITLFSQLIPITKDRLENARVVRDECEQILTAHSRWQCSLIITNLGATPFVLFPEEIFLHVKGKEIQPFELPCRLLREVSGEKGEDTVDGGRWEEVQGLAIVRSGTTEDLAIVTKQTQGEIGGGSVLRGAYSAGNSEAFVKMYGLGGELPWKRWIKSSAIPFKGAQA
jgi:hypothetical protein